MTTLFTSSLRWLALLALLVCGACVQDMDPSPNSDAGGAPNDGGAAGNDAAPVVDAGQVIMDALPAPDANPCDYDGGMYDGGMYDGGMRDAGPCDNDAGMPIPDAGPFDDALSM